MGVIEPAIPLRALSERQKRIVHSHMPLVYLSLKRMNVPALNRRRRLDSRDLLHEGFITLVEAFRSHDAARHGKFAPYAMSRVQFSISRYLHESDGGVRVPFITQRRWKRDQPSAEDRHRPDRPPRQVAWSREIEKWAAERRNPDPDFHGTYPNPTLGDLVRDRCDAAMNEAIRTMRHDPQGPPRNLSVIERCQEDRWTIPESEMQTPIRRIARETDSSLGRVTRCEKDFHRRVADRLSNDAEFQRLMCQARRQGRGLKHRPD